MKKCTGLKRWAKGKHGLQALLSGHPSGGEERMVDVVVTDLGTVGCFFFFNFPLAYGRNTIMWYM